MLRLPRRDVAVLAACWWQVMFLTKCNAKLRVFSADSEAGPTSDPIIGFTRRLDQESDEMSRENQVAVDEQIRW